MTRPRLRMVLEALEDDVRGPLGEGQRAPEVSRSSTSCRLRGASTGAPTSPTTRRRLRSATTHPHLGNLTLVNGKLNPTLSNRPWTDAEADDHGLGNKGKRDYLLQHSELKLNAALSTNTCIPGTSRRSRPEPAASYGGSWISGRAPRMPNSLWEAQLRRPRRRALSPRNRGGWTTARSKRLLGSGSLSTPQPGDSSRRSWTSHRTRLRRPTLLNCWTLTQVRWG